MTREEWHQIKISAPGALAKCRQHFEKKHPHHWKKEMQDHERLIEFFQENGIKILITRSYNKFGYLVDAGGMKTGKGYMYAGILIAEAEALKIAFGDLERKVNQGNEG